MTRFVAMILICLYFGLGVYAKSLCTNTHQESEEQTSVTHIGWMDRLFGYRKPALYPCHHQLINTHARGGWEERTMITPCFSFCLFHELQLLSVPYWNHQSLNQSDRWTGLFGFSFHFRPLQFKCRISRSTIVLSNNQYRSWNRGWQIAQSTKLNAWYVWNMLTMPCKLCAATSSCVGFAKRNTKRRPVHTAEQSTIQAGKPVRSSESSFLTHRRHCSSSSSPSKARRWW